MMSCKCRFRIPFRLPVGKSASGEIPGGRSYQAFAVPSPGGTAFPPDALGPVYFRFSLN